MVGMSDCKDEAVAVGGSFLSSSSNKYLKTNILKYCKEENVLHHLKKYCFPLKELEVIYAAVTTWLCALRVSVFIYIYECVDRSGQSCRQVKRAGKECFGKFKGIYVY